MNVLAVMDARSAHDQLSRVKKAVCTSLETLKKGKNMSWRRRQQELTRIQICMDAQEVALSAQKKSFSNIDGAGSSSYVMKRMERGASLQKGCDEGVQDNGSGISAYDEMLNWNKRKKEADITEKATPHRERKYSTRDQQSQHSSAKKLEIMPNESVDQYAARLKNLDPSVQRTPEECVRMLAVLPKDGTKGKMHGVTVAWEQSGVIPITARTMQTRVTRYQEGDIKKAVR